MIAFRNSAWTASRLFLSSAYLAYAANFRWFRPRAYIASKVLGPLEQILFFALLGGYATGWNSVDFYVIGNAMETTALSGIFGVTMTIGMERNSGTLPYLFATPANRLAMFVGRAFMHILDGMLGVALGFLFGVLLFGLNLERANPIALLLTVLVATASTSALGLLLGSLSLITVNVMFVNNAASIALLALSGANVPVGDMPPLLQLVSQGLPLTRGIESARRIVAGAGLAEVAPLLAGELAIGAVYFVLGYLCFRSMETVARRRGTMEQV